MRPEFILRYFGRFHLLLALLFPVPWLVGLCYGEHAAWPYLLPTALLGAVGVTLAGLARDHRGSVAVDLRRREGFVAVAGSWLLIVAYGALPYVVAGAVPDLASAIFESASGFTTTGATILPDIEALPKGLLFWRSFSHWIGGMGIIVLSVAILPELAVGGMQLFSAESTGIGVDKLAPRIAATAKRLWVIYVALTGAEIVLLFVGGMDVYDSVTHAFATTATGGFSPKNTSVGHYQSLYIDVVILVFMFLAGTSFALQYRWFIRGQIRTFFRYAEVRIFTAVAVGATLLVTIDLWLSDVHEGLLSSLRYGGFHVVSILTTTGFGTGMEAGNFDTWPTFSKFLLVALMTIGGCAGSTAGGLKIIRILVVFKHAARECTRLLYPRMVRPITVDGKPVEEDVLRAMLGFFVLYVLVFLGATILLAMLQHDTSDGKSMDLVTAATASISALNSIGPGLGNVGPVENYAFVHGAGKLALAFCMLLGRLEIYTLLILFLPRFWHHR